MKCKVPPRYDNEVYLELEDLLIIGMLCCHGTRDQKANYLYDILQDDLKPSIAINDKDIVNAVTKILTISTIAIYRHVLEAYGTQASGDATSTGTPDKSAMKRNSKTPGIKGGNGNQNNFAKKLEKIDEDFFNTALEEFKEDIFPDRCNVMTRAEFIKQISKESNAWIFNMQSVREKADQILQGSS